MKYFIFTLFLITAPLSFAANSGSNTNSADSVYQIDVVAFKLLKNDQSPEAKAKGWLPYQAISFDNAINLNSAQNSQIAPVESNQNIYYQALPASKFFLNTETRHLNNSSDYKIIAQVSWLQPITESPAPQRVYFSGGNVFTLNGSLIPEVSGTVLLTQSLYQYFNLNVNFYLIEPSDAGLVMQKVSENRRILVNQLNYIDSPNLGLLIKVKKI